jgi:hypothetical protein
MEVGVVCILYLPTACLGLTAGNWEEKKTGANSRRKTNKPTTEGEGEHWETGSVSERSFRELMGQKSAPFTGRTGSVVRQGTNPF